MNDHITQPMAARLKAAGWEGETFWFYRIDRDTPIQSNLQQTWKRLLPNEWLPAPSIGELRWNADGTERLTKADFGDYYLAKIYLARDVPMFAEWLFTVTADADALAEIWIWKEEK